MSIKDLWVGPCEQVSNVPITCRRYGHGKPSSRLSTEACIFSTALLAIMGEKMGIDPRTGQSACYGLGQEPFLSGAVDLFKFVDDYAMGCYALTAWDMYGLGPYADWAWDACGVLVGFPLQGVHRFESSRLLDMSNRLFVAVSLLLINGIMFINESWLYFTIIACLTTLPWLSLGLFGLKFN
jgi:hypothetical protein